jgi:hypothetical protein
VSCVSIKAPAASPDCLTGAVAAPGDGAAAAAAPRFAPTHTLVVGAAPASCASFTNASRGPLHTGRCPLHAATKPTGAKLSRQRAAGATQRPSAARHAYGTPARRTQAEQSSTTRKPLAHASRTAQLSRDWRAPASAFRLHRSATPSGTPRRRRSAQPGARCTARAALRLPLPTPSHGSAAGASRGAVSPAATMSTTATLPPGGAAAAGWQAPPSSRAPEGSLASHHARLGSQPLHALGRHGGARGVAEDRPTSSSAAVTASCFAASSPWPPAPSAASQLALRRASLPGGDGRRRAARQRRVCCRR